ncbi:inactive peptidyl-prolyl cis-trans isomerase FKBP6 [Chrysoperla carnea]|uniref:inactive peptidyl-prolyl cis-trans isomerase FKBP6 n=1 Tax=Chrysoperla carnea TaxID=189513 RepID=UPI001D099462|nr:inactive peptidyl-prolyl cis-trans isomerase FKBP6 [Chrysoperla carnea]
MSTNISLEEEDAFTKPIKLTEGLSLDALLNEGATFEINPDMLSDNVIKDDENFREELLSHTRYFDCFDDDSGDENDDLSQYDRLALKMKNVDDKGYVKKRILHPGNGEKIPENAAVTIHYDGFFEEGDEPFDTTLNNNPRVYRLGAGNLIMGMELAIASMENREIAQFLIEPIYGFGKFGCPNRIPGDARLMFRIEVIKFVDSITQDLYDKMSITNRKSFQTVRKLAETYQNQAKDSFKKQNFKGAIRSYNDAIRILETAQLADMSEQEKQQNSLLKNYTNLAVCYNALGKYRKTCLVCQKIYDLTRDRTLNVTAKAYFHHGRALFNIQEYRQAKIFYLKAKQLAPNNSEISKELCELEKKIDEELVKEKNHARLLFGSEKKETPKVSELENLNPEFVNKIKNFLRKFKNSNDLVQDLPPGLTTREIDFIRMECESLDLEFASYSNEDSKTFIQTVLKRTNTSS